MYNYFKIENFVTRTAIPFPGNIVDFPSNNY